MSDRAPTHRAAALVAALALLLVSTDALAFLSMALPAAARALAAEGGACEAAGCACASACGTRCACPGHGPEDGDSAPPARGVSLLQAWRCAGGGEAAPPGQVSLDPMTLLRCEDAALAAVSRPDPIFVASTPDSRAPSPPEKVPRRDARAVS